MHRVLLLGVCLVSGGVGAQPGQELAEVPVSPEEPWRAASLWIQPVATVVAGSAGAAFGEGFIVLPLGLSKPLSPTQELVIELTPIMRLPPRSESSVALYLAVGSSWMIRPDTRGGGFFVHAKGIGAIGQSSPGPYHVGEPYPAAEAQLAMGLDIGHRSRFKHVFVDVLVGVNVGMGFNVSFPNLFADIITQRAGRGTQFIIEPNFHFLRIGSSF